MKTNPKICWLSDSPTTVTGFATISKNMMNGLIDIGYTSQDQVNFFAHNMYSQTIMPGLNFEDGTSLKFKIHGCGMEQYYKDMIIPKINKLQPDVFGILLDTFMLFPWILQYDFSPAKTIFYFPSDGGGGMPDGCEAVLRKFHMPVAMSEFAQKQVWDYYGIKTEMIPHAVDDNLYKKLDKETCKRRFGLSGKFVVGTVARNQGRKMMDRTFKAFYEFAKDKPDVVLFLHSDPRDGASVFRMDKLIQMYNLENKVVFSGMRFFDGFDYRDMPAVYNAMDVFVLSTSGEGFGVPIIEAMACEVPVVVTDYTTTPELVMKNGQCGEPVALAGCEKISMSDLMIEKGMNLKEIDLVLGNGTITGSWSVERGLMDINDCANKLTKLYNNPLLIEQYGKTGRKKVESTYSWRVVIPQWVKVIDKLLAM